MNITGKELLGFLFQSAISEYLGEEIASKICQEEQIKKPIPEAEPADCIDTEGESI